MIVGLRAILLLVLCSPAGLATQVTKPIKPKLGRPVEFNRDVAPILRDNCVACHNATTNESDVILETAAQVIKGGSEGPAVVAGKPDLSLLYQVAAGGEPSMPPLPNDVNAKALTPTELGILRQWIEEGAKADAAGSKTIAWSPIHKQLKAVYSVAYDETAGTIAATRSNTIQLYDLHSQTSLDTLVDPSLKQAHQDVVQSLAFHPGGNLLASGGYRVVKLWARETTVQTIAPRASVMALADDGRFALATDNHSIQIYRSPTDKTPIVRPGHVHPIVAMCFAQAGRFASVDESGQLHIWDTKTDSPTGAVKLSGQPTGIAWVKNRIVVGTETGSLLTLNSDAVDVAPMELKGHTAAITCLTAIKDTDTLLSGSADKSVRTWNLSQAKQVQSVILTDVVTSLAVSPDRKRFAATTGNGDVSVWLSNGKLLATCKLDGTQTRHLKSLKRSQQITDRRLAYRTARVNAAKAEVDTQTKSRKTASDTLAKASKMQRTATEKKNAAARKVKAAAAGLKAKPTDKAAKSKLEGLNKNLAKLVEAEAKAVKATQAAKQDLAITSRSLERAKKTHASEVARQKLETESRIAIAARIKDAGTNVTPLAPALSVHFDSETCLTSLHADGTRRRWNPQSGQPQSVTRARLTRVRAVSNPARSISTLPDGLVVSVITRWTLQKSQGIGTIAGRVTALAFDPSGSRLAIGSGIASRTGQLQVWDIASGTLAQDFADAHSDTVLSVEFSPDGQQILSAGADKFAKVWDVESGRHLRSFEGHSHHVLAASWQPDMTRVATAGGDKVIKIWDSETGEQKRTISSHSKQVTGLRYVGTADTVVSCSGDRTVRAFTTGNGRTTRTFGGSNDYVHAVAAAKDQSIVVSGAEDGVVRVWDGRTGKSIAVFSPPTDGGSSR
jgi:WD40 repeat protein